MKLSLKVILFVCVIFLLLAAIIQIPSVQRYLLSTTTNYISELTGFKITVLKIRLDWFDEIVLEEATLWDKQNQKMIHLNEGKIDYTIISALKGQFNIDNITLTNGEINLVRYVGSEDINISEFIWVIQDLTTPKVKRIGPPIPVEIPKFTLDDMLFSYHDKREPFIEGDYFDHNHFTMDSIFGTITNIYAVLDTIRLETHQLKVNLRESHLEIYELTTDFLLDKHQIECKNLYAKVGESELKDYFRFYYNDINELSDFNEKVDITLRLQESTINSKDIAHFAPSINHISDIINVTVDMQGRINRFSLDKLNLAFGEESFVKGKMRFNGLPNIPETFMDIAVTNMSVVAADIVQYTGLSSAEIVDQFGRISGKGEFLGLVNDFTINGKFTTSLGYLEPDINLKFAETDQEKSYYEGSLITKEFNLGALLDIEFMKRVDMNGQIEGKGFSANDAALEVNAEISSIELYDYPLKNISTTATFANNFFDGKISINDSNLVLNAEGKVDMKKKPESFDIFGRVERSNLEKLNIVSTPTHLSADFDIDFHGIEIDSMIGNVDFRNIQLLSGAKEIDFKQVSLSINKNETTRFVDITSDVVNAHIKGNFFTTNIISDVQFFYEEFKMYYHKSESEVNDYYLSKEVVEREPYTGSFSINLKDINSLLDLYTPGIYIAQNTFAEGSFSSGEASQLILQSSIDTLIIFGNELYKNKVDATISKEVVGNDVLAAFYLSSGSQHYKNSFKTKNFVLEGQWIDNSIGFSAYVEQFENSNKISLKGDISVKDSLKTIVFRDSYIDLVDNRWVIPDSNSIDFTNKSIKFNYFNIHNGEQSFTATGNFSDNDKEFVTFLVNRFELENLNPLIEYKLKGMVNGKVEVRNVLKNLNLNGKISVSDFTVDNFIFGDIKGQADWLEAEEKLNVNVSLFKENLTIINVTGDVKPKNERRKESINLLAKFDDANLGVLSPILKGVISELDGDVFGAIKISGAFDDIRLSGEARVEKGKFKLDYLGSIFSFQDKIYFSEDQIRFRNMVLSDDEGNKGKINGGIFYDGFKNFLVDLKGDYKNLKLLNTTERDNSLFYGTAYATGTFSLFGPFNDLEIKATARSNKETRIYIPLTGDSEVSQKDFIKFVTKKYSNEKTIADSARNFRLRLFFNMEITSDAYTEIIFDKRAGDIIRGRGDGNIEFHYDTNGDMVMFGNYAFSEGRYNFTMAGIVNKEFVIDKGSRISWNGQPYDGVLDIKAKYSQNVSLAPLFDTTYKSRPDLKRSYPTDVILNVKGNLLSPDITMDIDILRYPSEIDLSTVVKDFEAKIKINEQELNRQVFSLIMLRSFTSPNSFSGVSSVGTSTVSELLSGQLSQFLSQVDHNLEINVNLKNMNKDALNTFNLRFSYTMLDGRLRITRDGSFQNVQSTSQASVSNIAGEWTVEYLLSEDGKLRIKLFNRINNNALISSSGNTNTTAGVSIMHVQSFNNLGELFGRKSPKRKEELIIPFDDHFDEEIEPDDSLEPSVPQQQNQIIVPDINQ